MFSLYLRFHNTGVKIHSDNKDVLKVIRNNLIPHVSSQNSLPYTAEVAIQKARKVIEIPPDYKRLAYYHNVQIFQSPDRRRYFVTDGFSNADLRPREGKSKIFIYPPVLREPSLFTPLFFTVLLIELLRHRGLYYLHSGAVSIDGKTGILIAGEGNTGKTTLAISFIKRGYYYLGDDALFISRDDNGKIFAHAYARDFLITRDTLKYFPEFANIPDTGSMKLTLSIRRNFKNKLIKYCEPRIILFTKINNKNITELHELKPSVALKNLILCSQQVMFDHLIAKEHLNALIQLISQCFCFEIALGKDILENSENTISELEETICQYLK